MRPPCLGSTALGMRPPSRRDHAGLRQRRGGDHAVRLRSCGAVRFRRPTALRKRHRPNSDLRPCDLRSASRPHGRRGPFTLVRRPMALTINCQRYGDATMWQSAAGRTGRPCDHCGQRRRRPCDQGERPPRPAVLVRGCDHRAVVTMRIAAVSGTRPASGPWWCGTAGMRPGGSNLALCVRPARQLARLFRCSLQGGRQDDRSLPSG